MRNARTHRSIPAVAERHRGFTAIEVLMAIGLIAATAGVTIPMYRQYQVYADLDTATEHLVQATHAAQTLSQTGKFDSVWGVYFPDGTLFAGPSYAERNADKDVSFPLPASIDTSGLDEITFTRVDGLPNATGQVCIYSTVADGYRTIDIDAQGLITVSTIKHGGCSGGSSGGGGAGGDQGGTSGTTSGATSGTTSGGTSGDTSGSTSGTTSGGTSGTTSGGTSGSTSGTTSGGTSGDTSGSTSGGSGSSSSSSSSSSVGDTGGTGGEVEDTDSDDDVEDRDDRDNGDNDSTDDEDDGEGHGGGHPSCEVRFILDKRRNGKVKNHGTNDIKLKVLGSSMTYGNGGPKVDVRVSASTDDGSTWNDMFEGRGINANDQHTIGNVEDGASLVLRFNGRYSWLFNKTFRSDGNDGHVYVLRNGDAVPDYSQLKNSAQLDAFLKNVIDAQGKISIGAKDVLFIVELGTLDQRTSKFTGAVILATYAEKASTCTSKDQPRVRLSFRRAENSGDGDLKPRVFVGPNALSFRKNQWIPLKDRDGNVIVDNGLMEDVRGVALERGNGWIRIRQHGSHPNSSGKEIANIKVRFRKAWINSIVNDVDQNASENPTDTIINDTSTGDEFVDGRTKKSMFFYTRVTTDDDGVVIYWTEVKPDGSGSSSSSSSSSSSAAATIQTDSCAIPYSVSPSGVVTLKGKADVTVRIAGSESTYGERGPRVSVRGRISFNNGQSWQQLYGSKAVRGGELSVFRNVASGSQIALSFNGRYSWVFNRSADVGDNDHMKVLRKGQSCTGLSTLKQSGQIKKFLGSIVDDDGKMKVSGNEVAYLVEFADPAHPKFQDVVAVISIDRPVGAASCTVSSSSSSSVSSSSSSSSSTLPANVDTDNDGVTNEKDWCPFNTTLPEPVPTEYMSFERLALTQPRGNTNKIPVFRSGPRKQVSEFTLKSTHGCSCAQILDAINEQGYNRFSEHPALFRQMKNLFKFYLDSSRKFGCSESLIKMVSEAEQEDD